ncbi:MAG: nicotinate-nucleotide--dimethylbenzimidazole phosphoribosyltransferase [Haloglomus sp.]
MRMLLVGGVTATAEIDGISAAGADPDVMVHTPSADMEIVEYGRPVRSPVVPVSPSGCPTPAVVTRAVRDHVPFETLVVDAGLAKPTGAPAVTIGGTPGDDIRTPEPVPDASTIVAEAREFGRNLPDDEVVIGETIPGGTTTALGVLTALGEEITVSSSLPENPLALKRDVVEQALASSDLSPGSAAGEPVRAIREVGDPVLAAVCGLTTGLVEGGTDVTLAGGTQMITAAALGRHAGLTEELSIATTSFVAADESADVTAAAERLDLDLTVTDPLFEDADHPAMAAYVAGEAKEGVGMGGALALAAAADVPMADVKSALADRYADLLAESDRPTEGTGAEREGST